MELERLSFAEAVERLADRFGVELPPGVAGEPAAAGRAGAARRRDRGGAGVLRASGSATTGRAPSSSAAASRLEFAAEFGLGYAPAEWRALYDALHRKFSERVLIEAGLSSRASRAGVGPLPRSGHDPDPRGARQADRVRRPRRRRRQPASTSTRRKRRCSPRARCCSPRTGRSGVHPEPTARSWSRAYFDCLALHQAGIEDAVATLGTALSEHHARELSRKVPRVVVCYDGDSAGRKAAVTALRTLLAANLEVTVVLLPDGQDPDDVVRARGRDGFLALLDAAATPTEFLLGEIGPDPRRAPPQPRPGAGGDQRLPGHGAALADEGEPRLRRGAAPRGARRVGIAARPRHRGRDHRDAAARRGGDPARPPGRPPDRAAAGSSQRAAPRRGRPPGDADDPGRPCGTGGQR